MEIYQETLVLIFLLKLKEKFSHDQGLYIILDPRQFECEMNIRDKNTEMSGMKKKTYMEHLRYNEQEQNA